MHNQTRDEQSVLSEKGFNVKQANGSSPTYNIITHLVVKNRTGSYPFGLSHMPYLPNDYDSYKVCRRKRKKEKEEGRRENREGKREKGTKLYSVVVVVVAVEEEEI